MQTEDTPYGLIYRELWAILESSPTFCELVPPCNRVKLWGSDREPFKPEQITADFPEVSIVDVSGSIASRSSSTVVQSKTWRISALTGDMRLTYLHFPLEWAIVTALAGEVTERSRLMQLRWRGHEFMACVAMGATSASIAQSSDGRNGLIKGWSEIIAVRTDIQIGLDWRQE